MTASPGHKQHPDHQVKEYKDEYVYTVTLFGQAIAQSKDVIRVVEDGHPDRYYFPKDSVDEKVLQPVDTTSSCPFKGKANYYNLKFGKDKLTDAVWTYEDPYDEHKNLEGRLAFYEDKYEDLEVRRDLEDRVTEANI